jgi:hypothetical protein
MSEESEWERNLNGEAAVNENEKLNEFTDVTRCCGEIYERTVPTE